MLFELSDLEKKSKDELLAICIRLDKALELSCEELLKLEEALAVYRQAYRLACEKCKRAYDLEYISCDCKIGSVASFEKQFLVQAKELLKKENTKNE